MNSHIGDEQIMEAFLAGGDAITRSHLHECAACREELDRMRGAITGFEAHVRAEAREFTGVAVTRMPGPVRPVWPRSSWAAALALLVFASALLWFSPAPRTPDASQPDSDDALLREIERDLDREGPAALAPVNVLTAERNRILLKAEKTQVR